MPVIAHTNILMFFSGLAIPHTAKVVAEVQHDLILGADFLSQNQVLIDYRENIVSLADDLVRVPLQSFQKQQNCVFTTQSVCIPPFTEATICVSSPNYFNEKTVIIEPVSSFQFRSFAVARSLSKCQNGKTVCTILNYNPKALVLRKGVKIASIENINTLVTCVPYIERTVQNSVNSLSADNVTTARTHEELDKFLDDYKFKINLELSVEQKYELLNLLFNYKSVFARSLEEIKQYPHYELELDLLSNRKVFRRQFRLHPDDAETAQKQINEMYRSGVIETAQTADYNSPIFLVGKRDGSKRLVTDLCGINELVAPKLVQLPKINELLDSVTSTKCKYMSTVDLRSGYFQVKLQRESRPLTSFTAPNGLRWHYRVCPFGLNTSPSAMLTVLTNIFSGKSSKIHCYMDDILVTSSTWNEHLINLKLMLQTLQDNQLTCNPSKCDFCSTEIEYLGFRISESGIRISEKKIAAIKAIVAPTNRKSLQRILGMLNFWRKFIPNFAQRSANMRHLLTKDAPFIWTGSCQEELEYLKNCLVKDPILQPLDMNRDIYINTDASCTGGYSYVLMQYGPDNNLHVVSYGAQAITKAQRKYTAAELELVAVVLALKAIECFALQRTVIILTDNSRVLHLDRWPVVNARQRRLLTYLMQFRLTIRYIRGCKNYTADALSRIFEDMTEEQKREFLPAPNQEEFNVTVNDSPSPYFQRKLKKEWYPYIYPDRVIEKRAKEKESNGLATFNNNQKNETVLDDVLFLRQQCFSNFQEPQNDFSVTPLRCKAKSWPDLKKLSASLDNQTTEYCASTSNLLDSETDQSKPSKTLLIGESLSQNSPIIGRDYEDDVEFQDIFRYLNTGELTGDDKKDKLTLLMADQYFVEGGVLYRLTTPRNKRVARVKPVIERLCIPKKYRFDLLNYYHSNLGHFGVQRLFLSLVQKVYWKQLFNDVHEFCQTCDVCLRSKRHFGFKSTPLHPFTVPSRPFIQWHLDHKTLTRKTKQNNVAILCCIDAFSGWPVIVAVPDLTAFTTAKIFFRYVVAVYGVPELIVSDKGTSFTGAFFSHLAKLLNVTHRTSSATTSKSNGLAESLVKRVSEMIKLYATDDTEIEDTLPIMEMALRSTASTRLNLSPFNICFGYEMSVADPNKTAETSSFSGDYKKYFDWLANDLRILHEAVRENKMEIKQDDKNQYDKRKSAAVPQFKIGDQVLLFDNRVRPHSNKVLTHRNYESGPYFISDLVQGEEDIGLVYQLIHVDTGKSYKRLVPADRLKPYTGDRTDLMARLPSNTQAQPVRSNVDSDATELKTTLNDDELVPVQSQPTDISGCELAKRILRERVRNKQKQYYVLFADGSRAWADYVTPTLLQYYRISQDRRRQRQRLKRLKQRGQRS